MRVLIVGEGKSGTTALLRSVASALGEPAELFEPADLVAADISPDPLVAKKLLLSWSDAESEALPRFDKHVLVIRDPRDRLISHLLYDAYNRGPRMTADQRSRWLDVLGTKLDQPEKVPVLRLIDVWWQVSGADLMNAHFRALQRIMAFEQRFQELFHLTSYESYVQGDFDRLSEYLELPIETATVKETEARVLRRAAVGDWRSWFTPIDIAAFRPTTERWLRRAGYGRNDWKLADQPDLDAESTIDYVANLLESSGPPRIPDSELRD